MEKKLSKIVNIKKEEFDSFVKTKQIKLRRANLIPTSKIGDEMALTSVLLSSMKLVKEFRKLIQTDLKMMKGGQLYVYTEVEFPEFPESRVDGLILVVQSGIIKDACILEMKNGTNCLEISQIEKYLEIAKRFNIPKLTTVSNEYVSDPTQFPLDIKKPKEVELYHFSWSYLLTLSHLLLFENEMNIADEDQVEIMKEVLHFYECDKSGVTGFTQMKQGWTKTIDNINSGAMIRSTDTDVKETILSWQQEERDLALMMSRNLGVLVKSGESRYISKYQERFDSDTKELIENKKLYSVYQVAGAVSDIKVYGHFEKKAIEMSVKLKVPSDKTLKGQTGWIRKQFENCEKKNQEEFSKISSEILIEVYIKNTTKSVRVNLSDLEKINEDLKGKEIRECKIIQFKDFGKLFSSRSKFVETIELMMMTYYTCIVQNLKKWDAPAPKLVKANDSLEAELDGFAPPPLPIVKNEFQSTSYSFESEKIEVEPEVESISGDVDEIAS